MACFCASGAHVLEGTLRSGSQSQPFSTRRPRESRYKIVPSQRPPMNAIVDPNGPSLVSIPSNPVPEGARVGYFKTSDNVRLRYATWPKGEGVHRGTICLVQGRT